MKIISTIARRTATVVAISMAAVAFGAGAPAANAASAAQPAASLVSTGIGDGVWAPSHDESLAIIPLCKGPAPTLNWLKLNFSDHGTDIGRFLTTQFTTLTWLTKNSSNPFGVLQLLLMPFLQIPVYAINDTTFHVPATLGDILSFCKSARV